MAVPVWFVRAALALRRALLSLADRLVPAHVAVLERAMGSSYTAGIGAAIRVGLIDALARGPATAAMLAVRTGVPEDRLVRLLRAMRSVGIVVQRSGGLWDLGRLGRPLVGSGVSVRQWALLWSEPWMMAAWGDLGESAADGQDHFQRRSGMGMWQWLEGNAGPRATFAWAMAERTRAEASAIVDAMKLPTGACLCDVGGGVGELLVEALGRDPSASGVLVELAGVVPMAAERLDRAGIADRVRVVAGSFVDGPIPAGCSAYVLKNILHDWGGEVALGIVRGVAGVAGRGARVYVVELLLDDAVMGDVAAQVDVSMLLLTVDGRERTSAELASLMSRAGLQVERMTQTSVGLTVIAAVAP